MSSAAGNHHGQAAGAGAAPAAVARLVREVAGPLRDAHLRLRDSWCARGGRAARQSESPQARGLPLGHRRAQVRSVRALACVRACAPEHRVPANTRRGVNGARARAAQGVGAGGGAGSVRRGAVGGRGARPGTIAAARRQRHAFRHRAWRALAAGSATAASTPRRGGRNTKYQIPNILVTPRGVWLWVIACV